MLPGKMRLFRRILWIQLVFWPGIAGCAGDFSQERTVLASPGMRVPPVLIRSGRRPVPGQLVLLGGRILKKVPTSGGCLFLVGALPLAGEAPGSSASGKSRFSGRDAFLLSISALRPTGAPRTGMQKGKRVSARAIGPGDLVTVLGEAKGWGRLSGGPVSRRYLLVRGWYLERW